MNKIKKVIDDLIDKLENLQVKVKSGQSIKRDDEDESKKKKKHHCHRSFDSEYGRKKFRYNIPVHSSSDKRKFRRCQNSSTILQVFEIRQYCRISVIGKIIMELRKL
ncbi:unnamed protein product [Rotaria sordida]|uniref:Uncharacterized protein n=1 Tax=Rotaria sordida TaxID=392033 RepID=A0A815IMR2_9BILA|nr:unnamed protein product [Rotaria sordida]